MPQIPNQRYTLNAFAYCRRIKLHQPFLHRTFLDPRYDYSREVSLLSARAVISITKALGNVKSPFGLAHETSFFVTQQVFFATVVLVMDLCCTGVRLNEEAQRKEVFGACKMLEDFKKNSPVANKYVESLKKVMRKHEVDLPTPTIQAEASAVVTVNETASFQNASWIENVESLGDAQKELSFDIVPHGLWQSYFNMDIDPDHIDWGQLFAELDSRGS
jgi:hypothetical protein